MSTVRFLATFIIIFTFSSHANACACLQEGDQLALHDIVFKGTVTWSGEDKKANTSAAGKNKRMLGHYSTFKISEVYKGALGNKVNIHYRKGGGTSCDFGGYEWGAEYIIYANKGENDHYSVSTCTPRTKIKDLQEYINPHAKPGLARLAKISESIKSIDALIEENPKVLTFYFKKAEILKEINDFQRLELVYAAALKISTPAEITKIHDEYGQALYNLRKYEEAIPHFEKANTDRSKILRQTALIYIGRKQDVDGQALNFSGLTLENIDFSDMNIPNSDFSNARLIKATFKNSKLSGSDFNGAQLQVTAENSDFKNINFANTKITGTILDSNFENADFTKSEMSLNEASRNNFRGANFTDAKLHIMEGRGETEGSEGSDYSNAKFIRTNIGGLAKSNITGADFTGASFYTGRSNSSRNMGLDLSGQKLDGSKLDSSNFSGGSFKGASLKNSTFTGSNLSEVNFTDADLTGADFTASSYGGPTQLHGADFSKAILQDAKWEGAVYDCQTKFPAGFDVLLERLEAADASCAKKPPLGYIPYSKERLYNGNINVCNGDYRAACIYAFIINFSVVQQPGSYTSRRIHTFIEIARSLVDAGEFDLAKMLLMRAYAEHHDIYQSSLTDREFFTILNKAGIEYPMENLREARSPPKVSLSERKSEQRDQALTYLSKGDKAMARKAAIAGLEEISRYPATNKKMQVLLVYADIFARIDGALNPELVKELEKEIRHKPYKDDSKKDSSRPEPSDYVARGAQLLRIPDNHVRENPR